MWYVVSSFLFGISKMSDMCQIEIGKTYSVYQKQTHISEIEVVIYSHGDDTKTNAAHQYGVVVGSKSGLRMRK